MTGDVLDPAECAALAEIIGGRLTMPAECAVAHSLVERGFITLEAGVPTPTEAGLARHHKIYGGDLRMPKPPCARRS